MSEFMVVAAFFFAMVLDPPIFLIAILGTAGTFFLGPHLALNHHLMRAGRGGAGMVSTRTSVHADLAAGHAVHSLCCGACLGTSNSGRGKTSNTRQTRIGSATSVVSTDCKVRFVRSNSDASMAAQRARSVWGSP
jgi:hypothetical protein